MEASNVEHETWNCPGCGYPLGTVVGGELFVGPIRIEMAALRCRWCGHKKMWRRSDAVLERLVETMLSWESDGAAPE